MPRSNHRPSLLGVNSKQGLKLLENPVLIKITVGRKDEKIAWILPKSLLTHGSDFFNAALNGTFAESGSRLMTMPEDSPEAFRLFVQWLYIGDILIDDVEEWLEAWVLGDKLGNIAFRDCAMTKLVKEHKHYCLTAETVATAYRKSVSGSKLRKWALDQFLFDSRSAYLHVHAQYWVSVVETETEFVADAAKAAISFTGEEIEDPSARLDSYLGK